MLKCNPRFLIFLVLVTCHTSFGHLTALGQSATATLSGTVEDQNGAIVPGATITVKSQSTRSSRQTVINDAGYFTVSLLPPGTYTVTAQHDGFKEVQIDIVLNVGDQKVVRIPLQTGDVKEVVNVTGEAPLINESPAVGTVVDRQFASNIPLNGRSFQSLIALTPGVVVVPANVGGGATNSQGQFSVNGQRASSNSFLVDGVSADYGASPNSGQAAQTGGNLPGLSVFGTTQSLVSVDAMQEFKVQTSTYAAEYGRHPGGQISIATRSGTNDFHGSLFDYLRNDKLDANDWFANANGQPRPPERQNDFGGTFSGPILLPHFGEGDHLLGYNGRDRSFFFFSYEGLRLRQPSFALTNVPTPALRQQAAVSVQPILNAFPLPNGRDLGNGLAEFAASYSNPSTLNATSIRIDHALNQKLTLFGRYNQAPSTTASRSLGNLNLTTFQTLDTKTITLGLTAILSPILTNDFRFNYSDNFGYSGVTQGNFAGAVPMPRNVLVLPQFDSSSAQGSAALRFVGQTSSGRPLVDFVDRNVNSQRQYNFVDFLTYGLGRHQLKFGFDYRRLTPITAVNSYNSQATFRTIQQLQTGTAGGGFTILASLPTRPIFENISTFAQDAWRASTRLRLDLGLRWDINPAPGEASGNDQLAVTQISSLATMDLAPRGTKAWRTTFGNFAPRFGAAYQLSQRSGRQAVLRGGFGVFFDTGNDQGARGFSNFPFTSTKTLATLNFPLVASQVAPAAIPAQMSTIPTPYGNLSAFDPDLKLPYTLEWSAAIEQSLGANNLFTVTYVGSSGRRLLQLRRLSLAAINPRFTVFNLTANAASSNYHSLQAQFQKRLSHGLQALVFYTWSHAIDDDSQSFTQRVAQRGNADFDIRHNFAAALTYDINLLKRSGGAYSLLKDWSVDATIHARSALPVDLVASAIIDPTTGDAINVRPNLLAGVPLYIQDATVPGGRKINAAAFATPTAGQSGTLGRNVLRGFAATQLDFALRRQLKISEKLSLQLRAEAFNILNHPNFGTIQTDLTAANFGLAITLLNSQLGGVSPIYQIGGPRSFQFALKILF